MKTLKHIFESVILDSRIDFPQETLCKDIWDKKNNSYILKPDIKKLILDMTETIKSQELFNIIKDVRLVGSMGSNQYTDNSDIDIHFTLNKVYKVNTIEDLNKKLKEFLVDKKIFVETHPIEFYFQQNEYQDLMSAGVYDINNDEWIIGPTEVDLDFNPYDEFADSFPIIGEYIKRIEEYFYNIKKTDDSSEIEKEINNLLKIKQELKEYRHHVSTPSNEEEAQEFREDKEWKKVDAVFKFIDKFGYLKKITLIEKLIKDKEINKDIIKEVKEIL